MSESSSLKTPSITEAQALPSSPIPSNHKLLWEELCKEREEKRKAVEEYKQSKLDEYENTTNPAVVYLDKEVFPLINQALVKMLHKTKEEDGFFRQKSVFNGVDFLSEYLYNKNPKHPEREDNWTYIFDTEFAQKALMENPRSIYPRSRVWSNDFAALKIQAFVRGYWVRRRSDVQEVRQFWKELRKCKSEENFGDMY